MVGWRVDWFKTIVLGIVLFALQIEDLKKDKGNCRVFLNPAQFVIPENDGELDIVAFVLAKNKAQSDLSFSSGTHTLTHLLNHLLTHLLS